VNDNNIASKSVQNQDIFPNIPDEVSHSTIQTKSQDVEIARDVSQDIYFVGTPEKPSGTIEKLRDKAERIRFETDYKAPSQAVFKRFGGGLAIVGLGAVAGGVGIIKAVASPVQTAKSIGTAILNPVKTGSYILAEAKGNPLFFFGEGIGAGYVSGKLFNIVASKLPKPKQSLVIERKTLTEPPTYEITRAKDIQISNQLIKQEGSNNLLLQSQTKLRTEKSISPTPEPVNIGNLGVEYGTVKARYRRENGLTQIDLVGSKGTGSISNLNKPKIKNAEIKDMDSLSIFDESIARESFFIEKTGSKAKVTTKIYEPQTLRTSNPIDLIKDRPFQTVTTQLKNQESVRTSKKQITPIFDYQKGQELIGASTTSIRFRELPEGADVIIQKASRKVPERKSIHDLTTPAEIQKRTDVQSSPQKFNEQFLKSPKLEVKYTEPVLKVRELKGRTRVVETKTLKTITKPQRNVNIVQAVSPFIATISKQEQNQKPIFSQKLDNAFKQEPVTKQTPIFDFKTLQEQQQKPAVAFDFPYPTVYDTVRRGATPPPSKLFLAVPPTMEYNEYGSKPLRKSLKVKTKYAPDLSAIIYNIKGKRPKGLLTGIETRPIISSKNKKEENFLAFI